MASLLEEFYRASALVTGTKVCDSAAKVELLLFKVSKGQTAGTFIGLPFGVSLSSEQIDVLYPQGNNFTIADEAGLRNQLNTRGVSSTDTETTIQRLTRGGKAAIPIEPGKAAKLVVELKPGGTWEIYGRDK